jgi:hypothetical protein
VLTKVRYKSLLFFAADFLVLSITTKNRLLHNDRMRVLRLIYVHGIYGIGFYFMDTPNLRPTNILYKIVREMKCWHGFWTCLRTYIFTEQSVENNLTPVETSLNPLAFIHLCEA